MRDQEWVACSVIEFNDGGPPSVMLLHRGTKEDCVKVAELPDAIAYAGDRGPSIVESYIIVTEAENFVEEAAPTNGKH